MRHVIRAAAAALCLIPSVGRAQLWNALDTVPRPNAIIGYDTSVTMRINTNCSSCHRRGLHPTQERVWLARLDLMDTMPLFQDYFTFGGFEYQGCGSARIVRRVTPNVADPDASFAATRELIGNARGCNSSERSFAGVSAINCITPTAMCAGDPPVLGRLFLGELPGLNIPAPPTHTSTVCGNPSALTPTLDVEALIASEAAGFAWPRWDTDENQITGRHVQDDLCAPLFSVLSAVRTALNRCLVAPNDYWNLSGITGVTGAWCTPGLIANNACQGGSPFDGTCVCDGMLPGCQVGGFFASPCGRPLTWKARQQVAVCETYNPATMGAAFRAQPDNIVEGGCRENVAMFFTDGYEGHRAGVGFEATAAQDTYASAAGQSNMFVFRIADSFRGSADAMMWTVSGNRIPQAFEANDGNQMRTSFSQVLARVFRGDFTGAAPSIARTGDRVALSSFVVPGYADGAPVSDTYIGWPNRVSVHELTEDGALGPALYQTDWQDRAQPKTGFCAHTPIGGEDVPNLGPGGNFRNGVARTVTVGANSLGQRRAGGPLEPPVGLRWGRFFGFGATRPVIVDGPNEVPNPAWMAEWQSHLEANGERPRIIYTMGGGYVLGFFGGAHDGARVVNGRYQSQTYRDGDGEAGTEVLRYRPSWMAAGAQNQPGRSPGFDVTLNPLVPQRLTTGELTVQEVRVRPGGGPEFRTVLLGAQGKEGAGYFALDVSDPCAPELMWERLLPAGASASARPEIFYLPEAGGEVRASAVTTGGLDGLPMLYALDLLSGDMFRTQPLPEEAGASYPTAPTCVDVTGEGVVTHCYVLRSDGGLFRVAVTELGFEAPEDITPPGPNSPRDGMRVFSTEPAVFFGTDGAVNLVFGSGSHRDLTTPGPVNGVFKVVDEGTRQRPVAGVASIDDACAPSGGDSSGFIPLRAGVRVVSPPVVQDGVVAWTTYETASTGCVAGSAEVAAMRFDTCEDALDPDNDRPQPVSIGLGIPTSPALHAASGQLLVRTSQGGQGGDVGGHAAAVTSGVRPWARKLYWRYELDVR